jgi:hypothetical protein
MQDVARGLHYLHGMGVVHGSIYIVRTYDLQGTVIWLDCWQRNVMINERGHAVLSIESSLAFADSEISYTSGAPSLGLAPHVPPECLQELRRSRTFKMTRAMDIHMLGVMLYEVHIQSHTVFWILKITSRYFLERS